MNLLLFVSLKSLIRLFRVQKGMRGWSVPPLPTPPICPTSSQLSSWLSSHCLTGNYESPLSPLASPILQVFCLPLVTSSLLTISQVHSAPHPLRTVGLQSRKEPLEEPAQSPKYSPHLPCPLAALWQRRLILSSHAVHPTEPHCSFQVTIPLPTCPLAFLLRPLPTI